MRAGDDPTRRDRTTAARSAVAPGRVVCHDPVVTCSTSAARAAAWNSSPTAFDESPATRSWGTGLTAARRVWIARATPPFTNRTSRVLPFGLVSRVDGDQHPVAVGRVVDVGGGR